MGGKARRDPWEALLANASDRSDAALRQRLAQTYIEQEIKEINLFRDERRPPGAGRSPGPRARSARCSTPS